MRKKFHRFSMLKFINLNVNVHVGKIFIRELPELPIKKPFFEVSIAHVILRNCSMVLYANVSGLLQPELTINAILI